MSCTPKPLIRPCRVLSVAQPATKTLFLFTCAVSVVSAIAHHPSNPCPRFARWRSDTAIHFCQSTLDVDPTWLVGYNPLVTCWFFALRFPRLERTVAPDRISCVIAYFQTWRRRNFLAMYVFNFITNRSTQRQGKSRPISPILATWRALGLPS
jgi:hypothetical protein